MALKQFSRNRGEFIQSGYFYSSSSSLLLLRRAPNYSIYTVLEFHAESRVKDLSKVPTWWQEWDSNPPSCRLVQGPYLVARVGFEPAILQTQGVDHTTEPPRPTEIGCWLIQSKIVMTCIHYFLLLCSLPRCSILPHILSYFLLLHSLFQSFLKALFCL